MPQQPKNPNKPVAVALRQQGLSYGEIAKRLGIKPNTVAGWCANAKRKALAKEAKEAAKNQDPSKLIPLPTVNPLPSVNTQGNLPLPLVNTSAERQPDQNSQLSESELRQKALNILASGASGKHIPKGRREWAEWVLKSTSKTAASKEGTGKASAYSTMGDRELAERGIAASCAALGGHAVDEIIMRLKDEGQFYL